MISETSYESDGSVKDYYSYEYDSEGNVTKKIGFNPNGSLIFYETYDYIFDEKGRLIEKNVYKQ